MEDIRIGLTKNVHNYRDLYDPADLILRITGNELGVRPYSRYPKDKYSELYGF